MRFRHEDRARKGIYGQNRYPLDLLHNEYLIQTQTAFDEFDKHNKFGSHTTQAQGSPVDESWAIQVRSPAPEGQPPTDPPPVVARSSQLLRDGYMHAGSRVVPSRLPDQYEQVGSVTIIRHGQYPTPEAAIFADGARRYHESLVERYGPDNVEMCPDGSRPVRDGTILGQQIAYFVRLDTHIPGESPTGQGS